MGCQRKSISCPATKVQKRNGPTTTVCLAGIEPSQEVFLSNRLFDREAHGFAVGRHQDSATNPVVEGVFPLLEVFKL